MAGIALTVVRPGLASPDHTSLNWRAATAALNRQSDIGTLPVIAVSPFVESQNDWVPGYHLPGILYAPAYVYPPRGQVYPFPLEASAEVEGYAKSVMTRVLVPSGRFLVYGKGGYTGDWIRWLASQAELSGWRYESRFHGDVIVEEFEKPFH
jgi:hypothetical protein